MSEQHFPRLVSKSVRHICPFSNDPEDINQIASLQLIDEVLEALRFFVHHHIDVEAAHEAKGGPVVVDDGIVRFYR